MTTTITLTAVQLWAICPLVITVALLTWATVASAKAGAQSGGGYGRIGAGLYGLLVFGAALIVSLAAWLVYFIAILVLK